MYKEIDQGGDEGGESIDAEDRMRDLQHARYLLQRMNPPK
jgi:hypothetical protein